jgi:transcriptional regulator with XRE-family HTH domain
MVANSHAISVTRRRTPGTPNSDLGACLAANAQKIFVRNLNRWLEQIGLTNAEFARKVGVSEAAVHNWKKGKISPALSTLGAVAEALGVHVWQLFDDPDESKPAPKLRLDPAEEALRALAEQLGKKIRFDRLKNP